MHIGKRIIELGTQYDTSFFRDQTKLKKYMGLAAGAVEIQLDLHKGLPLEYPNLHENTGSLHMCSWFSMTESESGMQCEDLLRMPHSLSLSPCLYVSLSVSPICGRNILNLKKEIEYMHTILIRLSPEKNISKQQYIFILK